MLAHRLQVGPHEKAHIRSLPRELRAIVAPERTGADDGDGFWKSVHQSKLVVTQPGARQGCRAAT